MISSVDWIGHLHETCFEFYRCHYYLSAGVLTPYGCPKHGVLHEYDQLLCKAIDRYRHAPTVRELDIDISHNETH